MSQASNSRQIKSLLRQLSEARDEIAKLTKLLDPTAPQSLSQATMYVTRKTSNQAARRENGLLMFLTKRKIAIVPSVLALCCLFFFAWGSSLTYYSALCLLLYSLWTIGIPAWFFLEFFYLYNCNFPRFNEFKHLQDLAKAFWLSVAVVLALTYSQQTGLKVSTEFSTKQVEAEKKLQETEARIKTASDQLSAIQKKLETLQKPTVPAIPNGK